VVSVEQTKTPTVVEVVEAKKPSSVIVEEPLRLEEEPEEFEEAVVTEATTPAEAPKHVETPTKPTEDEETSIPEESLRLEEEGPEEEEPVVEEQAQEEPKGRAGSRL
jgi:hypothetical protein